MWRQGREEGLSRGGWDRGGDGDRTEKGMRTGEKGETGKEGQDRGKE